MCDLGLAIGPISGGLQAAGAADATGSNREAYDALSEGDRNNSFLKTLGGSIGSKLEESSEEESDLLRDKNMLKMAGGC